MAQQQSQSERITINNLVPQSLPDDYQSRMYQILFIDKDSAMQVDFTDYTA